MKMIFPKHDIIAMHTELAAICKRVHKLILIIEIAPCHRLDKFHYFRLLEKLATWRRNNGFDRSEVLPERQRRIQWHACSVNDPEHSESEIYFESRWQPSPQELTESMWADVDWLRQELLL